MHTPASRPRILLLTSLLLASISSTAAASNGSGAVFVYSLPGGGNDQFVFALNANSATSDLYMHMSAPPGNSWMAVGIGEVMQGALIFTAYASSNGTGITLSPRTSDAHSEPSYTSDIHCDLITGNDSLPNANTVTSTGHSHGPGNHGDNGAMTLDAVCRNVTSWKGGSLAIPSTDGAGAKDQPFIFAVGPDDMLNSDSATAGLGRHSFFGRFTMDMNVATSTSPGVPVANSGNGSYVAASSSQATQTKRDSDHASYLHGFIMCLSYVILFPLGALVLRVLQRVIGHAIVQGIAVVLVTLASGLGMYISSEYNKSKSYASAHQIIGILLWLALLAQLGMGVLHHRIWERNQLPTMFNKIHLILGPAVVLIGIFNAGLGFHFAGNNGLGIIFAVIVVVVAIGFVLVRTCSNAVRRRKNLKHQGVGVEGYQQPAFDPSLRSRQQAVGVTEGIAPPPYAAEDGASRGDIPLQRYNTQTPHFPRPGAF